MMKLFQFWNSTQAPEDVEKLLETWKVDSAFDYQRFSLETADAFIEGHFDARTLAAFRACGVPAMQADFFRYCALYANGGIYVDADTENGGNLPEMLEGRSRGLLMQREDRVANDFLYVTCKQDPLYALVIERAIENVESRRSNNVWEITGPGIMTRMYNTPNTRGHFEGFDFESVWTVKRYLNFRNDLAYKDSANDWRKSLTPESKSIYLP